MMKARELRIGNWITLVKDNIYQNKDYQLEAYDIYKASEFDDITQCLLPIPLTEEWIERFGFTKSTTQDKFYTKDNTVGVSTADDKFRFIQGNFICQLVLVELKYVHELQNLYYCLYKSELINQSK